MTTDPPVADTPNDDRPEHLSAVTEAVTDAAEPVMAALDRLREAAASHDPDSPAPG